MKLNLLSIALFLTPILAVPLGSRSQAIRASTFAPESWPISSLNVHFRGNPSPKYNVPQFNSTVDFAISISNETVTCAISFEEKKLPSEWTACDSSEDLAVAFQLAPVGEVLDETHFELIVRRLFSSGDSGGWLGSQIITANDPSKEDSYLTCLGGAPMDGIRCKLGGMLSVRKELVIVGRDSREDEEGEGY